MASARLPANALFLGMTPDGLSVYATETGIIAKKQPKPPWHSTVVALLVDLHRISPPEYEAYRAKQRDLAEIFTDSRLLCYPTWRWLHGQRRHRFKPVERYFLSADRLIRRLHEEDDGQNRREL